VTSRIPRWTLRQNGTLEVYQGDLGAGGPSYAQPVEVICRLESARKLVIDQNGNELAARARVFLEPTVTLTPESRVTVDGVTYRVLDVSRMIGPGGHAHHLEVMLI